MGKKPEKKPLTDKKRQQLTQIAADKISSAQSQKTPLKRILQQSLVVEVFKSGKANEPIDNLYIVTGDKKQRTNIRSELVKSSIYYDYDKIGKYWAVRIKDTYKEDTSILCNSLLGASAIMRTTPDQLESLVEAHFANIEKGGGSPQR